MDYTFTDKVRQALNADIARRLLIKYFISKGFSNMDTQVYPGLIQDLPEAIPQLADKVEVVPHAITIDPMLDKAVLGWNLFVLGTQRQYLGETYHHGLSTLAMQLKQRNVVGSDMHATRQTTAKRIIAFITRVLESHEQGQLDLDATPTPWGTGSQGPRMGGPTKVGHFFTRSGYGT